MTPAKCMTSKSSKFDSISAIGGPRLVVFAGLKHSSTNCREEGADVCVDNTCQYRTQVNAGSTYLLQVRLSGTAQNARAYLDYNNDGDFQLPKEEIMVGSMNNKWTVASSITIPRTGVVYNKPLRLRIVSETTLVSSFGPCSALQNGQAEDYAVTILPGVGVENISSNILQTISPNPAKAFVNVSFERPFSGELELYNSMGQSVKRYEVTAQTSVRVDTNSLSSGIYYLQSRNEHGVKCGKVLIEQ